MKAIRVRAFGGPEVMKLEELPEPRPGRGEIENGTVRPVVGKQFPLAQAPQAHATVLEPGAQGKIVLVL